MNTETEVWRQIADFPNYSVSNLGRIRRDAKGGGARAGRILKYNLTTKGYLMVQLYRDFKKYPRLVSRLVTTAFHGEAPAPNMHAAHGDNDKTNNRGTNLRWATKRENEDDKFVHGTSPRGARNPMSKLTETIVMGIKADLSRGRSYKDLAAVHSVSRATINYIAIGRTWKHVP